MKDKVRERENSPNLFFVGLVILAKKLEQILFDFFLLNNLLYPSSLENNTYNQVLVELFS